MSDADDEPADANASDDELGDVDALMNGDDDDDSDEDDEEEE